MRIIRDLIENEIINAHTEYMKGGLDKKKWSLVAAKRIMTKLKKHEPN